MSPTKRSTTKRPSVPDQARKIANSLDALWLLLQTSSATEIKTRFMTEMNEILGAVAEVSTAIRARFGHNEAVDFMGRVERTINELIVVAKRVERGMQPGQDAVRQAGTSMALTRDSIRVWANELDRSENSVGRNQQPVKKSKPKIKLNTTSELVTINGGKPIRLNGGHAVEFIRTLLNSRGKRVKATKFTTLGIRPDREYRKLPASLRSCISKPGRGQTGYYIDCR